MEVRGSPLDVELHQAYLALAEQSLEDGERFRSSFFAYKSRAAARGETVAPEQIDNWSIPAQFIEELEIASARLIVALAETQRVYQPRLAASAQTRFDCWLAAEESPRREATAQSCRLGFIEALDALNQALAEQ